MPYLNLDPNYHRHPKTLRLIALLGRAADIYPIRAWAYLALVAPESGSFGEMSAVEIEALVSWPGAPGELVRVLEKLKFFDKTPKGWKAHDWLDHEGHLGVFKRRSRRANRLRWARYSMSPTRSSSRTPKRHLKDSLEPPPAVPTIPTTITTSAAKAAHKENSAFHSFMDRFFKEMMGLSPGDPNPLKREAVAAAYRRFGRAGRDILAFAEGDPVLAFEGTDAVGKRLDELELPWKLDTVAQHFQDWRIGGGIFNAKKKNGE